LQKNARALFCLGGVSTPPSLDQREVHQTCAFPPSQFGDAVFWSEDNSENLNDASSGTVSKDKTKSKHEKGCSNSHIGCQSPNGPQRPRIEDERSGKHVRVYESQLKRKVSDDFPLSELNRPFSSCSPLSSQCVVPPWRIWLHTPVWKRAGPGSNVNNDLSSAGRCRLGNSQDSRIISVGPVALLPHLVARIVCRRTGFVVAIGQRLRHRFRAPTVAVCWFTQRRRPALGVVQPRQTVRRSSASGWRLQGDGVCKFRLFRL